MDFQLTPGAQRALAEATWWSFGGNSQTLEASALLLGLLAESECRAALLLGERDIDPGTVRQRWPGLVRLTAPLAALDDEHRFSDGDMVWAPPRLGGDLRSSFLALTCRLRDVAEDTPLSTEHLLLALSVGEHEVSDWLRQRGIDSASIEADICRQYGLRRDPVCLEEEPLPCDELPADPDSLKSLSPAPLLSQEPSPPNALKRPGQAESGGLAWQRMGILRVMDASANRAREGLRVVEDYVRFILDDCHLTGQLKRLRHALTAALTSIPRGDLLAARETQFDVGTRISTPSEQHREDTPSVVAANFVRVQESLRSLEEFGKVLDPAMAAKMEEMRYLAYTLQRAVEITASSLQRLCRARLYVLVDGRGSAGEFRSLVEALVRSGVDVLQLRDKRLADRELLGRARLLRELTRGTDTLFIVNDRPDLALVCQADGVHVGQSEFGVKEARTVVGPDVLVGVSTHSIEQARQAVLDGADYLGVGPTFPSGTKHFDAFPGTDLLHAVSAEIRLPAFAIGGICADNLGEVLRSGFCRVAISSAVVEAPDPAKAARELLAALGRER